MSIRPRSRRSAGITLVEVLAAIFISGVGLLAILALFPIGALSMRQAVKDDRSAHGLAMGALADAVEQTGAELSSLVAAGLANGQFSSQALSRLHAALRIEEATAQRLLEELAVRIRQASDLEERWKLFKAATALRYLKSLVGQAKLRLGDLRRFLSLAG